MFGRYDEQGGAPDMKRARLGGGFSSGPMGPGMGGMGGGFPDSGAGSGRGGAGLLSSGPGMGTGQAPATARPSKVLQLTNVPQAATEADVIDACSQFGMINYVHLAGRGTCFVEFETLKSAEAAIQYNSTTDLFVMQTAVYATFADMDMIPRRGFESERPGTVLVMNVQSPKYPITVDVINAITKPISPPSKLLILKKRGGMDPTNVSVTVLGEFVDTESARLVKQRLNGCDIYSGCCTLKIEYAKFEITRLNVTKNDQDQCDYAGQGGGGGASREWLAGVEGLGECVASHDLLFASPLTGPGCPTCGCPVSTRALAGRDTSPEPPPPLPAPTTSVPQRYRNLPPGLRLAPKAKPSGQGLLAPPAQPPLIPTSSRVNAPDNRSQQNRPIAATPMGNSRDTTSAFSASFCDRESRQIQARIEELGIQRQPKATHGNKSRKQKKHQKTLKMNLEKAKKDKKMEKARKDKKKLAQEAKKAKKTPEKPSAEHPKENPKTEVVTPAKKGLPEHLRTACLSTDVSVLISRINSACAAATQEPAEEGGEPKEEQGETTFDASLHQFLKDSGLYKPAKEEPEPEPAAPTSWMGYLAQTPAAEPNEGGEPLTVPKEGSQNSRPDFQKDQGAGWRDHLSSHPVSHQSGGQCGGGVTRTLRCFICGGEHLSKDCGRGDKSEKTKTKSQKERDRKKRQKARLNALNQ